jgi:hypothetical protein
MSHKYYEIAPEKFNGILATIHNNGWNLRQDCLSLEEHNYVGQSRNTWKYPRKSNIDRSKTLSREEWSGKGIISASSDFIEKYKSAKTRILELCQNSNDEYAPNQTAQDLALHTLELLKTNKFLPSLINSTDDSSLIFEFFADDKFYLIEFYNSGEIIYLRRIEGQPKLVIEVKIDEINKIIKDISRAYIK